MITAQYLFHQLRTEETRRATAPAHQHSFWQIDRIASGGGTVLIGEAQLTFQAGDIIVLPQHVVHEFSYLAGVENAWLSVKFSVESTNPLAFSGAVIRNHALLMPLFDAIAAALNPAVVNHDYVTEIIDSLLASAVCCLELDKSDSETSRSPLVKAAMQYIYDHQGHYVSVAELGDALGYSGKYLSGCFFAETGIPLKKFIDTQRCEYAAGLLQTSANSLSEIAADLEFRDVFAFSRFFKREFGETLSGFRKRKVHDR